METETKVMIAVISAGSAIAGAIFSQVVSIVRDVLDKKHKRHILLREKYEELAHLITNSEEWFNNIMSAKSLLELRVIMPIESRTAMVLSHIYFPLLQESCQNYANACANFKLMLIDNHEFKEGVDVGTQAAHKNPAAFEKHAEHLHKCRDIIDKEIIKYAHMYTKA